MEIEASFIYRLGNLTLLENSKNKDCLNKSYEEKKEVYKISKYKMTANIDYPEWTPSQIMSRQKKLAKLAKTVWRIDF